LTNNWCDSGDLRERQKALREKSGGNNRVLWHVRYRAFEGEKLSGGWQRRLGIAMALIPEPSILFLDEPTLGLDVLARRGLWKMIEQLKGRVTMILTTHYLEEAEALSDRIGIMAHGELKAVGTAQELIKRANADNFEDAFIHFAREEG